MTILKQISTNIKQTIKSSLAIVLLLGSIAAGVSAFQMAPSGIKNTINNLSGGVTASAAPNCPAPAYFNTTDSLCHEDNLPLSTPNRRCFSLVDMADANGTCFYGSLPLFNCSANVSGQVEVWNSDDGVAGQRLCSKTPQYFSVGSCILYFNNSNNTTTNAGALNKIVNYLNQNGINNGISSNANSNTIADSWCNATNDNGFTYFSIGNGCPAGYRMVMDKGSQFHAKQGSSTTSFLCAKKSFMDGSELGGTPIQNTILYTTHTDGGQTYNNCTSINPNYTTTVISSNGNSGAERSTLCSITQYQASIPGCPVGQNYYQQGNFCYRVFAPLSFTCPAGQYLTNTGTDSCTPCPAGSYCPGGANAAAIPCLPGKTCPTIGLSTPTICPPNTYCTGGVAAPINCPTASPLAPAGSPVVGYCNANSYSINKKYSTFTPAVGTTPAVYGTETENLTGVQGGNTVNAIIRYDNTGGQSMTNAQIKDSLPAGFTYVPGSMRNCIEPNQTLAGTDISCDNLSTTDRNIMFTKLTGNGVGPTSGLYDLGNFDDTSLLFGKKRYMTTQPIGRYYINPEPCVPNIDLFGFTNSNSTSPGNVSGNCKGATDQSARDTLGNRYMIAQPFGRLSSGTVAPCIPSLDSFLFTNINNSPGNVSGTCKGATDQTAYDTYDKRFMTSKASGAYFNSGEPCGPSLDSFEWSNTLNGDGNVSATCIGVNDKRAYDTLDTTRGKGYFIYQMIAPTTPGVTTVGTDAILRSSVQTGTNPIVTPVTDVFVSGTANSITVNNTAPGVTLNLKAFLSGAYNSVTGLMNTQLDTRNLLPIAQPFNSTGVSANVPTAPYTGTESLPALATRATNITDWVLVEVRDATTNNLVSSKACVILADGTIKDAASATIANQTNAATNNITLSGLTRATNYKIVLRHKNHIAIATTPTVSFNSTTAIASLDFSNTATNTSIVLGQNQKNVGTTALPLYALRAGDASGDKAVDATDRNLLNISSEFDGVYNDKDLSLDGQIDATDRNISQNTGEAVANL